MDASKQKIFSFKEKYQYAEYAHFYKCLLKQKVGTYPVGAFIPHITIHTDTRKMFFRTLEGFWAAEFQLTEEMEIV